MFDVGFAELLLLAVVTLLVAGPERMPQIVRNVGKTWAKVRRFTSGIQKQIETELRIEELNQRIMDDTKGQSFLNNDELAETDKQTAPLTIDHPVTETSANEQSEHKDQNG
jgi:sec-independent protein translocase protein TatB